MAQNSRRLDSQEQYYTATANAYRLDEAAQELPLRQDEPKQSPQHRPQAQPGPAAQPKLKKSRVAKAAAVCAALIAVAVVQIAGYEGLSAASLRIAELREDIESIENEIDELNVQLQYAMDINTAQIIAKDALGMDYPLSSQLEKVEGGLAQAKAGAAPAPLYAAVPVSEANAAQQEQGEEVLEEETALREAAE